MPIVKKKSKKSKQRISKRVLIILSVIGAVMLIAGGLLVRSYLVERITLTNLSVAHDELKVVYDKILKNNGGNIASSYFRNDCSISNASWLEQKISCGPSGSIVLKTASSIVFATGIITQSTKGISIGNVSNVETGQDSAGISWETEKSGVKCFISYGKDILTNAWGYDLVCRKEVLHVLPNYIVKE